MVWLSLAKYILPPILLLGILFGVYYSGKFAERKQHVQKQLELKVERLEEEQKITDYGQKLKQKVAPIKKFPPSPAKDEVYSCLLSNDPLSNECDKLLQP